jgi:hypothetical protein
VTDYAENMCAVKKSPTGEKLGAFIGKAAEAFPVIGPATTGALAMLGDLFCSSYATSEEEAAYTAKLESLSDETEGLKTILTIVCPALLFCVTTH